MRRLTSALTYSNVVATAALFLALTGGVVYAATGLGKNAVKSQNIAANAVKARNLSKNAVKARSIAPNAVTGSKIASESITGANIKKGGVARSDLALGTLSGLPVAEAVAAAVPGLNVENEAAGTPVPLTGTLGFIPTAGKSYELLTELRGTPAPGPEGEPCSIEVEIFANGVPFQALRISSNPYGTPPYNSRPFDADSTAIGLQEPGQPVNLSAISYGSTSCSAGDAATLRSVVVEFG